jgi:hypothetical protein
VAQQETRFAPERECVLSFSNANMQAVDESLTLFLRPCWTHHVKKPPGVPGGFFACDP